MTLAVHREREEVAVAEALGDPERLPGDAGRRGEVPGGLVLEHPGQQEVSALGAIALGLHEPLRTPQPAAGRADLPA